MRIIRRMEKMGDKIYFLGRVIERTARGYSVEANPKYIRNVINVLGLKEAKSVMTPSVKRTPTTESLVDLIDLSETSIFLNVNWAHIHHVNSCFILEEQVCMQMRPLNSQISGVPHITALEGPLTCFRI